MKKYIFEANQFARPFGEILNGETGALEASLFSSARLIFKEIKAT